MGHSLIKIAVTSVLVLVLGARVWSADDTMPEKPDDAAAVEEPKDDAPNDTAEKPDPAKPDADKPDTVETDPAPEKAAPASSDEAVEDIKTAFEAASYDLVITEAPKVRKSAKKLMPEQRSNLALWEGESLLRKEKYTEAEKVLREAIISPPSAASVRAGEIVRILKPTLPSGKIEAGSLSDTAILEGALSAAGDPVAADARSLLEQIKTSMDAQKTINALKKATNPKNAKAPWNTRRDKFTNNMNRLRGLQPDKCKELAKELGTAECEHYVSVIGKLRRELGQGNPFKMRMSYWSGSEKITTTKWREFQVKVKDCAPPIIALRAAATLLAEAKTFPTAYGADEADSSLQPVETSVFAENAVQLLGDILDSDRPTIEKYEDWARNWQGLGNAAADE